jgi:prepilin-type N-terminal cleavage/methylation domain-containing protein
MKKAFTLVELLVAVAIISLLAALSLPVMRSVKEQGAETVCKSNLRQLALILKAYTNDHDHLFPRSHYIYHSPESFDLEKWPGYLACCRWHDARMGLDSALLRERPELRGSLWPYLRNRKIVLCKTGSRANELRGCYNHCCVCEHDPSIPVVAQYTYAINHHLGSTLLTGGSGTGTPGASVDLRTTREKEVRRDSQVTRSPSQVFVFGEANSWAINTEGRQPLYTEPYWAAEYELSGKYYRELVPPRWSMGTLLVPHIEILPTYRIKGTSLAREDRDIGDAFATCHRPRFRDLNTGHSHVAMLDAHVEKVTVADQLRASRRVPGMEESRFGPGGNLTLAWPLDIPPPGGWDNQ